MSESAKRDLESKSGKRNTRRHLGSSILMPFLENMVRTKRTCHGGGQCNYWHRLLAGYARRGVTINDRRSCRVQTEDGRCEDSEDRERSWCREAHFEQPWVQFIANANDPYILTHYFERSEGHIYVKVHASFQARSASQWRLPHRARVRDRRRFLVVPPPGKMKRWPEHHQPILLYS